MTKTKSKNKSKTAKSLTALMHLKLLLFLRTLPTLFWVSVTLIALTFNFAEISSAAPYPGMGSSALTNLDKGYFFTQWGFQLNRAQSNWSLDLPTENNDTKTEVLFSPPQESGKFASLSIQVEKLKTDISARAYAKKWLKDYKHFGFEILGSKSFSQNKNTGYVIDFIHQQKKQQFRQVLFSSEKTVVLLTCKDKQENFKESLPICNSIIETFNWKRKKTEEINRQKVF
jgi:hypothetical protein